MKKSIILPLIILLLLLSTAAFSACGLFGGDDDNGNTTTPSTDSADVNDTSIADISGIGYSVSNENEKAFYIFDTADFSKITFNTAKIETSDLALLNMYVFYGDKQQGELHQPSKDSDGQYKINSRFTFTQTGEYRLQIKVRGKEVKSYSTDYAIRVVSGGRPTGVRLEMKDTDNNSVTQLKAGNTFTLNATILTDDRVYTAVDENIVGCWNHDDKPRQTYEVTPIDSKNDTKAQYQYLIRFKSTNRGAYDFITYFEPSVTENFSHTEHDVAVGTLSANVKYSEGSGLFETMTVTDVYDNGNRKNKPIRWNTENIGSISNGDVVPMIAYGGSTDFTRYYNTMSELNVYENTANYVDTRINEQTQTTYQFRPIFNTCTVYLAYKGSQLIEGTSGAYRTTYTELEGTRRTVNLYNSVPNVRLHGVEGKIVGRMNTAGTSYDNYSKTATERVEDGITTYCVEVYDTMDVSGNGRIDSGDYGTTKQYFELDLRDGSDDLGRSYVGDYVFELQYPSEGAGSISFVKGNRVMLKSAYFYAVSTGTVLMNLKNASGTVFCRIELTVIQTPTPST